MDNENNEYENTELINSNKRKKINKRGDYVKIYLNYYKTNIYNYKLFNLTLQDREKYRVVKHIDEYIIIQVE